MADYQSKEITSVDDVTSVDSKAKIFINNNGSFGQTDIDKVVEKSALNTYVKNNSSLQTTSKDVIGAVNELNTNLENDFLQHMPISDMNTVDVKYHKIIFDQSTVPTNSPENISHGILIQNLRYIGVDNDIKIGEQTLIEYTGDKIFRRICWYDSWKSWQKIITQKA